MKSFLRLLYILLLQFFSAKAGAQTFDAPCPVNTFQKEFLNEHTTLPLKNTSSVLQASDGSILSFGKISNSWQLSSQYRDSNFITKLDHDGNIIWHKQLFSNYYRPQKIIELPGNNYLASFNNNSIDTGFLVKLNSAGNILWAKSYKDLTTNSSQDIILMGMILSEDFVFIHGMSADGLTLFKLDLDGIVLWSKTYSTTFSQTTFGSTGAFANDLMTADDEGVIITFPLTPVSYVNTIPIIKISKDNGNVIWAKEILRSNTSFFVNQLIKTTNGFSVIFTTRPGNSLQSNRKLTIANLSPQGNLINTFRVTDFNGTQKFILTEDKKLVGALSDTISAGIAPYIFYQTDMNGNIEWAKKYFFPIDNVSLNNSRPQFFQTPDKGLAVVISRRNTSNTQTLNHIIKTDRTGNSGDCPNVNIHINTEPYEVTLQPITVQRFDNTISVSSSSMLLNDVSLTVNSICEKVSDCDSIKLYGTDSVCNFTDSIVYKISRNPGCFTTAIWKLADTAFGKIMVQSDSTIKVKFNRSGQVLLKVFLPTPCFTLSDSILINVFDPADSLNIGPDLSFCSPQPVTLTAKPGYKNYLWQNGHTDNFLTVNDYGIYHVTVTDHCGNSFRDSVIISQQQPVPLYIGPDIFKCNRDSITLSAPVGFTNYTWGPAYNNLSSTTEKIIIFPYHDTSYFVAAEKTPGCISRDTIHIKVYKTLPIDLGKDTSFCIGASVMLDAGLDFDHYLWDGGQTTQTINVSQAGMYNIKAFDIHGCFSVDTFRVNSLFPKPQLNLKKDTVLCRGQQLQLNAGPGFFSYLWQNNSSAQNISVSDTGKYWLMVKNLQGCENTDTVHIRHWAEPPENFIWHDSTICSDKPLAVKVDGHFKNYLWSTGAVSNQITLTSAGNYWIQITDNNNCISKETFTVRKKDCTNGIYFPGAFTPNGDHLNDEFKPGIFGELTNYHLTVYNRYGQPVFSTTDVLKGWNGTFKSSPQNSGAFTWICQYTFAGKLAEVQKGTVLLLR